MIANDRLDQLVKRYGHIFPDDWDYNDILNFCCNWVMANIDDIQEFFEDDEG